MSLRNLCVIGGVAFIVITVGFFVLPHADASAADGITIPTTHPSLWFDGASDPRLIAARTWCASHPFTPVSNEGANDDFMGMAFYDLCNNTSTYTTAWYNEAISYSNSIPLGGTSCDACRDGGETLIVGYDWEYNNLSPSQRSALISSYDTWISYWMTQPWGGPTMPNSNYFWGYLRNELEWGTASYNDQPSIAKTFLDDALITRGTDAFAPTTLPGGSAEGGLPQEGTQYGRYLTWYSIIPFVSADLEGLDVYDEFNNFFKFSVINYIYSTSLNKVEKVNGGIDQNASYWELFPFNDDQFTFASSNVGSASSPFYSDDGNGSYIGDFMDVMANYYSTIPIGQYAKQWLNNTDLPLANHVAAVDNSGSITPLAFSNLPLDYYDKGIQYFYGHSSWNTQNSTQIMVQMGAPSGTGHAQDDYGNFQILRNGASGPSYFLTRETTSYSEAYTAYGDPGKWQGGTAYSVNTRVVPSTPNGFVYQQVADTTCTSGASAPAFPSTPLATVNDGTCIWLNNTNGVNGDRVAGSDLTAHNGVLVNGLGLAYGTKEAAPTVTRLESQPNYAYMDVDISKSYRNIVDTNHPERDNPAAAHVEREILFIRPLETTVILDRVTANAVGTLPAAAITKTFLDHCEVPWSLTDANHETCTDGSQALYVSTLLPTSFNRRVVNESSCPNAQNACDTDGQSRLEVDSADNCAQTYLLNVLQARAANGADVTTSVTDSNPGCSNVNNGTLTVKITPSGGQPTTIVFNKGQSVSGVETLNVNNSGATNMTTGVEGISLTDSGPVWSSSPPPPSDTTPPTTSITSPANNATVSSTITLTASASDNVAVSSVQFRLDGSNLGSPDTTSPYSVSWNTASSTNGSHVLSAIATDSSGNQGTASNVTVTVSNTVTPPPDTTPPSTPTNLATTNITSSSISLSWTASTDNVAVTGYNIYRGGTKIATSNSTSYVNTGLSASTTYTYTVSAYDAAGNTSAQSQSISGTTSAATVVPPPDTTPPTTSITSPANNATISGTTSITANASDNVSVTSVAFYVDGVIQTTDSSAPYTFSLNTTNLTNGSHTLSTKAYDGAGNIGTSENVPVTVSNTVVATTTPPVVTSTPPVTPPAGGGGGGGGGGGSTPPPSTGITSVSVSGITTNSAQVTITTNPSASIVVKYGLTTLYGKSTQASPSLTTNYVKLTDLSPNTIYDFVVIATPQGGTSVTSQGYTLQTSAVTTTGGGTTPTPSSTAPQAFTENLAYGNSGSQVTLLQEILYTQGFLPSKAYITGYFGIQTEHALLLFQNAHDLNKSGFVDTQTQSLLNKIVAAGGAGTGITTPPVPTPPTTTGSGTLTQNLAPGNSGSQVLILQTKLNQLGLLPSNDITGYYGTATEQAVKAFQSKYGIISYGSPYTTGYGAVGPKTRGELNSL